MKGRQPAQDGEDLGDISSVATELPGPGIRLADLRRRVSRGRRERHAQRRLQRQLLLGSFTRCRRRVDELETLLQMTDRLARRGSGKRQLPGRAVVGDRLVLFPRLGVVVSHQLGMSGKSFRKLLGQHPSDVMMVLLPSTLQKGVIGNFLDKRVLEDVRRIRRLPFLPEQVGFDEPSQMPAQGVIVESRHGCQDSV